MSHTPGPWSYEEPDWDTLPFLMAANGDVIATLFSEPRNSSDIPLIAAAPELFEALRDIYAALVIEEISTETRTRARLRARDALALVRGDEEERR